MTSATAPSLAQIECILKTLERMLSDRGYQRIQAFSLQQIFTLPTSAAPLTEASVLGDVRFLARQNVDPHRDGCMVLLCLGRKIGVNVTRGIVEILERVNSPLRVISNVILIHDSPADRSMQILSTRALQEFPAKAKYNVHCFEANRVTHPYPYHKDCSPHTLLSLEEEETFLKENRLDKAALTQIDVNDPIIKWYDWPRQRVIRVRKQRYGLGQARNQYDLIV
jgi:DNA-directed RNA polymerase subunit H (RpoH/RPB5)